MIRERYVGLSYFVPFCRSERTIARPAHPSCGFRSFRFGLRRKFFRHPNQNTVRTSQYQSFLDIVVGQGDHATSPFQKSPRLEIPPAFAFEEITKAMAAKSSTSWLVCP